MTPAEQIRQTINASGTKWIFWLSSALWGIVTTIMILTGKAIVDNERRNIEIHAIMYDKINTLNIKVATIESNRFTSKDAQELTQTILQTLPPKWLTDQVKENKSDIRNIKYKLIGPVNKP